MTNIELKEGWSAFGDEKEVLLLPFFCFQVIGIHVESDDLQELTTITVVEIPNQKLLKKREVAMSKLIWCDSNALTSEENVFYLEQLKGKFSEVTIVTCVPELLEEVNKIVKCVLLISGQMSRIVFPLIYPLPNVHKVVIFCREPRYYAGLYA